MARRKGKRITAGKQPQGHPLSGSAIKSGGPGFMGRKGSSGTLLKGSRKGGKRTT
jgi:hypothetical protein